MGDILGTDFMHTSTRKLPLRNTVRYVQTYKGVPVYGTELVITVNQNDVITTVSGGYMSALSLDNVKPTLSRADVEKSMAKMYVNGNADRFKVLESDLVIFQTMSESLLAWKIMMNFNDKFVTKSMEVLLHDADSSIIEENNLLLAKKDQDSGKVNGGLRG